jgi:hypothetical protein
VMGAAYERLYGEVRHRTAARPRLDAATLLR